MKARILSRLAEVCFILATVQVAWIGIGLLFPFGKPRHNPPPETFAHVILRLAPWFAVVLLVALGLYFKRLCNKRRSK
jgi:hypothetical protein